MRASMFHDMGYAYREGADPKSGELRLCSATFERHGAAGARMVAEATVVSTRQRYGQCLARIRAPSETMIRKGLVNQGCLRGLSVLPKTFLFIGEV